MKKSGKMQVSLMVLSKVTVQLVSDTQQMVKQVTISLHQKIFSLCRQNSVREIVALMIFLSTVTMT